MSKKKIFRKPFNPLVFLLTLAVSLFVTIYVFAWSAPEIWKVQISSKPEVILIIFLSIHLCGAFVEWFFHRAVHIGIMRDQIPQYISKIFEITRTDPEEIDRIREVTDKLVENGLLVANGVQVNLAPSIN